MTSEAEARSPAMPPEFSVLLADDCAEDGVYEFFFTAPPLPITKAVGSPINPMAIK